MTKIVFNMKEIETQEPELTYERCVAMKLGKLVLPGTPLHSVAWQGPGGAGTLVPGGPGVKVSEGLIVSVTRTDGA